MALSARARQAINADLKKVKAERRKKEEQRKRLDRDIEKLLQEEYELDKSLEE